MAGSSLTDGSGQLKEAVELLERVWQASEEGWSDIVRERFETENLDPLRKQLSQAQTAIQQLGDVLNAARRHAADADRNPN